MAWLPAPVDRGTLGLGAVAVSKITITLALFWAYNELQHMSLGVFLFFIKAG